MSQAPHPAPDRAVFRLGLAVTGLGVLVVGVLLALYANRAPERDDIELAYLFLPESTLALALEQLWSPLNEHRIALSELVRAVLLWITGDFRSAAWFQLAVFTLLALGFLVLARRLRGHSTAFDLLFPVLWLGWGNTHNWLLGVQVCVTLSTALSCVALASIAWAAAPPTPRRLALVGLAATLSPLCGGFGLCQAPVWIVWLAAAGLGHWRATPARRGTACAAWAWSLAGAAVVLLYFRELEFPAQAVEQPEVGRALGIAGQFLVVGLGEGAAYHPWFSGLAVGALLLVALFALARAALRDPAERWRASGFAAAIASTLLLGLSIGWSRQDGWPVAGFASRYVSAQTPALVAALLALALYLPGRTARAVLGLVCAAVLWVLPSNIQYGGAWARERHALLSSFADDAERRFPTALLAQTYAAEVYGSTSDFAARLAVLARAGLPPFDRHPAPPEIVPKLGVALGPGGRIESAAPEHAGERQVLGQPMLAVPAPGRIVLVPATGAQRMHGVVGVLPLAYGAFVPPEQRTRGIEVFVELVEPGGEVLELFHVELDPVEREEDRKQLWFDVGWPSERLGEIVLRCAPRAVTPGRYDVAVWAFTPPF